MFAGRFLFLVKKFNNIIFYDSGGPTELPGQVYAIGGDDGVPSTAALLRNQNPRIVGLSENGARGLNVAVSGGVVAGTRNTT